MMKDRSCEFEVRDFFLRVLDTFLERSSCWLHELTIVGCATSDRNRGGISASCIGKGGYRWALHRGHRGPNQVRIWDRGRRMSDRLRRRKHMIHGDHGLHHGELCVHVIVRPHRAPVRTPVRPCRKRRPSLLTSTYGDDGA
jgi:hypothetical protein